MPSSHCSGFGFSVLPALKGRAGSSSSTWLSPSLSRPSLQFVLVGTQETRPKKITKTGNRRCMGCSKLRRTLPYNPLTGEGRKNHAISDGWVGTGAGGWRGGG